MRLDFLIELTRRRMIDRYIGTSSRFLWVLFSPIIPLLVNVAVFYFVAKIPQVQSMGLASYAAFMFSGLLPFRMIQKATVEGCELLVANMEMLKTAVFPLPFLTISAVTALLIEFFIQCLFMAGLLIIAGSPISWTILLLPLAFVTLFAFALGSSWLLSLLNYALRDLQEIMSTLFSGLLYITPIVYPDDAAPSFLRTLIEINPLTSYVIMFRDTILPGSEGVHLHAWMVAGTTSIVFLAAGYFGIRSAQRFVGDMV